LVLIRGRWTRWRLAAYAAILGLAIATHIFAIVVLLVHVVWIAMNRSWPDLKQLTPAWVVAFVIGAAANANIEVMEFVQHGFPPSLFDPTFPRDLVLFLVGAPVLLTVGLWLSAAGLGLWAARREPRVWAAIAVLAVVVGILWLVLQPAYLFPRFFIFLIPGVAYLVAAAVQRWKVLAPIVAAGAVAAVVAQVPGYTQAPLALPQAAAAIEQTRAGGGEACVIHADEQVLAAYTTDFTVVTGADQLKGCTVVVVVSWNVDLALRDLAAQEFPRRTALPAYTLAWVWFSCRTRTARPRIRSQRQQKTTASMPHGRTPCSSTSRSRRCISQQMKKLIEPDEAITAATTKQRKDC